MELTRQRWISLPLLTLQGRTGRLIPMLLSSGMVCMKARHCSCLLPAASIPFVVPTGEMRGSGKTCLLPPWIDHKTDTIIREAFALGWPEAPACSYWFLLDENDPPIQGDSLALPVALAAVLLQQGQSWPNGFFATGGLQTDGTITSVSGLREKEQLARQHGCRLFLHPSPGPGPSPRSGSQACADLNQARDALQCFQSGHKPATIALYQACRYSLDHLLAHLHELPPGLIAPYPRLPGQQQWCQQMLARAAGNPGQYLAPLADCFRRCRNSPAHAAILSQLFEPQQLVSLISTNPSHDVVRAACSWIESMLAHATHHGDTDTAATWERISEQVRPQLELDDAIGLILREIVAERFNRYDFRPALPARFDALLSTIARAQKITGQSSYQLGAMYGTLAQNYGFCGPAFFPDLDQAARLAETAFGHRYKRETARTLNYRIYGLLDQGRHDLAASLLSSYLDLPGPADTNTIFQQALSLLRQQEQDSLFQAAVALRYLASANVLLQDRFPKEILPGVMQSHSHPWQLICVNLARLALVTDQTKPARQLLLKAINICEQGGATMQAMALLPLSLLHRYQLADVDTLDKAQKLRQWLVEESGLNQRHFSVLTGKSQPESLLATVWEKRKQLYPFSYR